MIRFLKYAILVAYLACAPAAGAQEPTGFTWTNATELSFVSTSGNASSSTLGVKGTLEAAGGANKLLFEGGAVRASSNITTRRAVGTAEDFTILEAVRSETTAESYFARSRYDRDLGGGFAFGGVGWNRNTFAGIWNRFQVVSGLGRVFVEGERSLLRADAGLTYTIQRDVDPAPGQDDSFGGWRASVNARRAVSQNAELRADFVLDNNLEDIEDVRTDLVTSLSVAITAGLALKTSLQVLWDNQPSLVAAPLESDVGVPVGIDVLTPGERVDSVFTVALVIKL